MSLNKYKSIINIEQLDALMLSLTSATNPASWIVAAVKLFIYGAYLTIRIKLIDLDMMIKKQEMEVIKEKEDQKDVDIVL